MVRTLEDKFKDHEHNGIDAKRVPFSEMEFTKGASVTAPSGGATVDTQARTAINDIISRLESLGLINEN